MSAGTFAWIHSFAVGDRYTATIWFPPGEKDQLVCAHIEWAPSKPTAASLSAAEWEDFRQGCEEGVIATHERNGADPSTAVDDLRRRFEATRVHQ